MKNLFICLGITLYEIHNGLVGLAQMKESNEDLKLYLEAEECLREAITHLLYEPPQSPEGNLQHRAMSELRALREIIQKAKIFFDEKSNQNFKLTRKATTKKK